MTRIEPGVVCDDSGLGSISGACTRLSIRGVVEFPGRPGQDYLTAGGGSQPLWGNLPPHSVGVRLGVAPFGGGDELHVPGAEDGLQFGGEIGGGTDLHIRPG